MQALFTPASFFPSDRGLRSENLHPSRGVTASGFRPLRNIPHCCLPQESGPCSSSSVAGHPLRPATHRCLGRPLPHQLANGTRTHLQVIACKQRPSFLPTIKSGAYSVLATVSSRYPHLEGRLSTRYSPVRHFTHPEGLSRSTCMC